MVTEQEVAKLAKLARLDLDETGLKEMTKEMEEIIAFADTINRTVGELDLRSKAGRIVEWGELRADEPRESLSSEEILTNAEESGEGYFILKRSKAK